MKWIWLSVSSIAFIAGLILLYFGLGEINQARASTNWHPADGIIVSSDLDVRTDEEGSTFYEANIIYDYSIDGQQYQGDRVFIGELSTTDRQAVFDLMLKYENGQRVIVYYDPADPTRVVLEPGVHGAAWFLPALGSGFSVLGLIFILAGFWANRKGYFG